MFTKAELDKLSVMYDGDKNRDATSKIRGFLYQDYVAIMCLLKEHVEYVCSEYLEDVDVFYENGTLEFIQVKYYPNTSQDMKDISTDLYYQYLRLQMLHSTLKVIPSLYIHRSLKVEKPTLDKMKTYINLEDGLPKSVSYPNAVDSDAWLRANVYITRKKDEQKKNLFASMASEQSLQEFVTKFDITHKPNINQYKEELMKALSQTYPNPVGNGKEEAGQEILLGLAILYIHRRYMLDNPCFDELKVDKKEFDQYMIGFEAMKSENTITSYLVNLVCEKYGEIIDHNNLLDIQIDMLNLIYKNTIRWVNDICQTEDGQYQLLNTFSVNEVDKIADYRGATVGDKLKYMAECKRDFIDFLSYLWKIMLNICQEKISKAEEIPAHSELLDPLHYIVSSVTEYVCLNFPEDKYINRTVILPQAGRDFTGVKRRIVSRMVNMLQKPEKWFFANGKLMKGKNYYRYSTANVNENPTVADLGDDSFYIECMECIEIEEGEWEKKDVCSHCIFCVKCVKEEE